MLRSPERDDAPATLAFLRLLARESSRYLNHPPSFFDALTDDAQATFLANACAHPRNVMIAAWLDGAVIGTADVTCSGSSFAAHVGEVGLGVLAPFQRLGVGRALTDALIAAATAAGITNLLLRVRTFNEPAIRLYEQLGFQRVGTLIGVACLPDAVADEHVYQRVGR